MSDLLFSKENKPTSKPKEVIETNTDTLLISRIDENKKEYRFPIDFVDYVERDYIPKDIVPSSEKVFKLNKPSDLKFNVLDFKQKNQLTQKLFRHGEATITSMTGYGEFLFVGNDKGIVKKFSTKSEVETSIFSDATINNINDSKAVLCIDVARNGKYIAIGYSNGFVGLWEMKGNNNKLIKLVDKAHRTGLVTIKFISADNSKYQLLTTDMEGNVILLSIDEGIFINTYSTSIIYRESSPTFVIALFSPSEQQKVLYPFCKTDTVIAAFGCIERVNVYMIQPDLRKLYVFNNPAYKSIKQIPDISFGIGLEPSPRDSQGRIIKSQQNKNNYCAMIAFSWDDTLSVYKIDLDNVTIDDANLCGFFNNCQIIRMGFLDTSIIYFYDGMKKIKLLNTALMNSKFEERSVKRDYVATPLLDEGEEIFGDILCQKQIYDPSDPNRKLKETYNNFFMAANKTIFFLCKKNCYLGTVQSWDELIKKFIEKGYWEKALFLGLDIFEGSISSLPGIPRDNDERKKDTHIKITDILLKYCPLMLGQFKHDDSIQVEDLDDNLRKFMNINIEICLRIDAIDFLLITLIPYFENKDKGDAFILLFEPFILLNRFQKYDIDKDTIEKFISVYSRKKDSFMLSQLLMKLKFESINIESVHKFCDDNNLFSLQIYLDCNNKMLFHPIEKMCSKFSQLKDFDDKEFIAYSYYLRKHKAKLSDLLTCKTYVGHKILWYCFFCLTGTIFSDFPMINQDDYDDLIIKMLNHLLKNEIFLMFVQFDSYSFFKVLSRFFVDKNIMSIITKEAYKDKIIISGLNEAFATDPLLERLFRHIIEISQRINSFLIQEDMNQFIALRAMNKGINEEKMVQSGTFLLSFFKEKNNYTPESIDDKFNCHGFISENHFYLKEISDILLIIIDLVDENAIKTFDTISEYSPFVLVKIKLLQKQCNYIKCLKEFLMNKDNLLLNKGMIFDWINKTMVELNQKSTELLFKFKSVLLEQMEILVSLSLKDTLILTEKWFNEDRNSVIKTLNKSPDIQFIFLENILKLIKEDELANEGEIKVKEYSELLLIHIQLLIKLNKKDQVLPNIKKRSFYPLKEILVLCIENNIRDAAIEINLLTGNNTNAINLGLETLEEAYDKTSKYAYSNCTSNDKWKELLKTYNDEKDMCVKICQKSHIASLQSKNEELWFTLLQRLYTYLNKLQDSDKPTTELSTEYTVILSKDIEIFLKEMCNYIHIQSIITKVTTTYQEAEFKHFKDLLNRMLSKFTHLTNLLDSARNLLNNNIRYNLIQYKKINAQGNTFNMNKCDECKKRFAFGEGVLAFRCGHLVHELPSCYVEEEQIITCKICRRNEVESIDLKNLQGTSLIFNRINEAIEDKKDWIVQKKKEKQNMMKKLKDFDKTFFEKSNLEIGNDDMFFF